MHFYVNSLKKTLSSSFSLPLPHRIDNKKYKVYSDKCLPLRIYS